MVTRALALLLALATAARADSPKLPQARTAVDEGRFDEAQRLLVGALNDGGNSTAAMREIYRLSASTALVLGQREVGEQYYRRWLALDAGAAVGADVAPKLREPFEAAQAYIAAHGRLTATATWRSASELEIAVSEPFAMAASATTTGGQPVALSTEHRARLTPTGTPPVTVAILDDHANHLLELQTAPPERIDPVPVAPPASVPARTTDATFLSTGSVSWDVQVDRRPACATPCSLQLAPRQFVVLQTADGDQRLDVGYLPTGSVVVKGRPSRMGRRALGVTFAVLSGAAIISGIAITAAGCSTEFGGLCIGGLITSAVGGLGMYGSVVMIRSGSASASVARGAPEVSAAYVGRF